MRENLHSILVDPEKNYHEHLFSRMYPNDLIIYCIYDLDLVDMTDIWLCVKKGHPNLRQAFDGLIQDMLVENKSPLRDEDEVESTSDKDCELVAVEYPVLDAS